MNQQTYRYSHQGSESAMPSSMGATLHSCRMRGYEPVLSQQSWPRVLRHVGGWLFLLGVFASAPGTGAFCALCKFLACGANASAAATAPLQTFAIATTITSVGSFIFFCLIALPLEKRYAEQEWTRCQKRARADVAKSFEPRAFVRRSDVRLAALNLTISASATVAIGIEHASATHSATRGATRIYFEPPHSAGDLAYLLASTTAFFVWIDFWAYVSHRFLHIPFMYRTIHKVHHTWKQTTACMAVGLEPDHCSSVLPLLSPPLPSSPLLSPPLLRRGG